MQAEAYFQFMNPLIFLLFAAGFFCIHAIRPSRAVLLLALSYVVGAAAFIVDIFAQAGFHLIGPIPIAAIYAMTAVLFSVALTLHYRGHAPWRLFGVVFAAHMAVYSWCYLTFGYGWGASLAANFGCGVIFGLGLFLIRKHMPRKIDKAIFWLCAVGMFQCFARPLMIAYFSGGMTAETFDLPVFLMVLQFVVGACAVVLGMTLLVAFSSEIVSDLEQRSATDRLSGLLNRRGFEETAEPIFEASSGKDDFITVILVDIDHFKRLNDTKGHAFGDMVIAEMGALMSQYADYGRFAGRIGGEEFALLLVGEPLEAAREVAEAIRLDFAALRVENGDADAGAFTASFGVAMRQPGEALRALMTRADEALYLAKAKGRNQISCETDVMVHKLRTVSVGDDDSAERRKFRDAALTG